MRSFLKFLADKGLASPLARKVVCGSGLWVFCYHDVTDTPSEFVQDFALNVRPEVFTSQIECILNHFNVISPQQLLFGKYDEPAALITFDDGWAGALENAVPILANLGCPSLHFLNFDSMDGKLPWMALVCWLFGHDSRFADEMAGELPEVEPSHRHAYVTLDMVDTYLAKVDSLAVETQVREYVGDMVAADDVRKDSPWVFFGNHLYRHQSAPVFLNDLNSLFLRAQDRLDKMSGGTTLFSYPFGERTEETDSMILSYGAQRLFTSVEKVNGANDLVLGRINMTEAVVTEKMFMRLLLRSRLRSFGI